MLEAVKGELHRLDVHCQAGSQRRLYSLTWMDRETQASPHPDDSS